MENRTVHNLVLALSMTLALGALTACTNPYDPAQRAIGGGLLGAGAGAALGGVAAGPEGALTGAVLGGALGAVGGAVTTPQRPSHQYYAPSTRYYAPPPPPRDYYNRY